MQMTCIGVSLQFAVLFECVFAQKACDCLLVVAPLQTDKARVWGSETDI